MRSSTNEWRILLRVEKQLIGAISLQQRTKTIKACAEDDTFYQRKFGISTSKVDFNFGVRVCQLTLTRQFPITRQSVAQ